MSDYIELPSNNLYSNGYLTTLDDGAVVLERTPLRIVPKEQDRWHFVESEDMLDELAQRYYSNIVEDAAKLWWLIADANGIDNPLDLDSVIGSLILIPEYFRIQRQLAIDTVEDTAFTFPVNWSSSYPVAVVYANSVLWDIEGQLFDSDGGLSDANGMQGALSDGDDELLSDIDAVLGDER